MTTPHDELLWLAYRYSVGELPADEAVTFEARLADDQTAREALAQAVGLTATVRALEHGELIGANSPELMPAAAARHNWSEREPMRTAGWLAAGIAACVAMVMTWQTFQTVQVDVANQQAAQQQLAQLEMAQQQLATSAVAASEPIDDETRLLLALLDEEQAAQPTMPALAVESDEMSEREFDLVLDDGGSEEPALEDQNVTPDWLLAAVAESQS